MSLPRTLFFSAIVTFYAGTALAQFPIITDEPEEENVRAAWLLDLDGGTGGDDWQGFEIAYASKIYPLDQFVISYAHASPDDAAKHSVMLSVEEYYPTGLAVVPYGVAGFGYMWTDFAEGTTGDSTGWFAKVGGGILFQINRSFSLYGEVAYHASDRDLWLDSDDADSQNVEALIGLRFHY